MNIHIKNLDIQPGQAIVITMGERTKVTEFGEIQRFAQAISSAYTKNPVMLVPKGLNIDLMDSSEYEKLHNKSNDPYPGQLIMKEFVESVGGVNE